MRFRQFLIAVDQLLNTVAGGYADETISCRAWRRKDDKKIWAIMRKVIDCIFFWQNNHCKKAYEAELNRKHLPKEFRD